MTMLGIIVGVAAIIATLAIGHGAEERVKQQLLAMGNNYIFIHSGNSISGEGIQKSSKQKDAQYLRMEDIDALDQQCPGINRISPTMFFDEQVTFMGTSIHSDIKAGNEDFISILGLKINKGMGLTQHHIKKSAKFAVLGPKAAKILFKSLDPIGRTIQIRNNTFTVIGVLQSIENFFGLKDPNLNIFIPISTAKKYLAKSKKYAASKIAGITISARNKEDVGLVVKRTRQILRARHRLELSDPDDFTIYDQMSMMKAAKDSSSVLNLLLLIIASISLIVGGIGVMNIMLVSVSERTKEIGVRMALGAPDKLILRQFLCESLTLCFIGGLIGIVLGGVIPLIASYFTGWIVSIKPISILLAFGTIVLVGLIFGYYPARKASRLNPVQALIDH